MADDSFFAGATQYFFYPGASLQEVYAGIALHGILTTKGGATATLLDKPIDCTPGEYLTMVCEEEQLAICERIANAAFTISEALAAKFEKIRGHGSTD